jgi:hypothetical protein
VFPRDYWEEIFKEEFSLSCHEVAADSLSRCISCSEKLIGQWMSGTLVAIICWILFVRCAGDRH